LQLTRITPEDSSALADAYIVSDGELEYDKVAQLGVYTIYRTVTTEAAPKTPPSN
jgi:hypothetical protein